jgi:hypothetical protein
MAMATAASGYPALLHETFKDHLHRRFFAFTAVQHALNWPVDELLFAIFPTGGAPRCSAMAGI